MGKAARDAANRMRGMAERARQPFDDGADDEILVARVRARLGRVVSHPHPLEVTANDGVVILRGPILAGEADPALRDAARVRGVRDVVDHLDRHVSAEHFPALQGGARPRRSAQWTPAVRGPALVGGALLALWGMVRRGLFAKLAGIAGWALALRAGANQPLAQMFALARGKAGIEVKKTIIVHAPIETVFGLWSHVENFPRFMQHVRKVELEDAARGRARWTIDGPGGMPLHFESEVVRSIPNREIAWRTLPDQKIEHAGSIRFEPDRAGTRVHVQMEYRPPGGVIAHAIAHLLGWDPKARMDDDLVRMKALLEDGRTRAHGSRVALEDVYRFS
jgi:uncharacterized membrane protein